MLVGQQVPSFDLPTDTGHFQLSDYVGKNVVVFFFQKQTHQVAQKKQSHSHNSDRIDAANTV